MKQKSFIRRAENEDAGTEDFPEPDTADEAPREAEAAEELSEDERPDGGFPPASSGHRAPKVEPEDENSAAVEEIEEGLSEADDDTRIRSRHTP